ncbi:MAG TPA: alkaline phosphatase family protein [Nocardioides sp.]|nr:alkaline phosphatase family protein [Nocardioides sp.]
MGPRGLSVLAVALAGGLLLAGCGGTNSSDTPSPDFPSQPSSSTGSSGTSSPASSTPTTKSAGATKLLVFVIENHSLSEMQAQMPWTYGLGKRYGYATDFHAMTHPSLPNYLAIAGGSTFGIQDDDNPSAHPLSGPSVFGEALAHGLTARVYADDMPAPCTLTTAGQYAVRHNPWTYFTAERSECQTFDTNLDRFPQDVRSGHLPDAGMVIPDVCDDAHNCPLSTADAFIRQGVGLAMSGPDFRSGRLAIVVTADEDDHSQGNVILTILVHPSVRHEVVTSPLSHLSLSRLYGEVLGLPPLRDAATAPSMAKAFGLRLGR